MNVFLKKKKTPFLSLWRLFSDGKYHEQIRIAENSTGYSYGALFKPYISNLLTEVWVEDPYIRHIHQVKTSLINKYTS